MPIKINYNNNVSKQKSLNSILFVDENFNLSGLKEIISKEDYSYISDLLKNSDLKESILFFKINSKKTIYLISLKKNLKASDLENLGAKFFDLVKDEKLNGYYINTEFKYKAINDFVGYFLHGLKLKSYEFNKYKSKNNKKKNPINVFVNKNK